MKTDHTMIQRKKTFGWLLLAMLMTSLGMSAANHTVKVKGAETTAVDPIYLSTTETKSSTATATQITVADGGTFYIILKDWDKSTTSKDLKGVKAKVYVDASKAQARTRATEESGPKVVETYTAQPVTAGDYTLFQITLYNISDLPESYVVVEAELQDKIDISSSQVSVALTDNKDRQKQTTPATQWNPTIASVTYTPTEGAASTLTEGTDYTISWPDSKNYQAAAYNGTMTAVAGTHYYGTRLIPYYIDKPDLVTEGENANGSIRLSTSQDIYDGATHQVKPIVTIDGTEQAASTYSVVWEKKTADDTAWETLATQPTADAEGNYSFGPGVGKWRALISATDASGYSFENIAREYVIAPKALPVADTPGAYTFEPEMREWTGAAQAGPTITVKDGSATLTEADYKITWKKAVDDNLENDVAHEGTTFTEVGTYHAYIEGKGNYESSVIRTFRIEKQTIEDQHIHLRMADDPETDVKEVVYTGSDRKPAVILIDDEGRTVAEDNYTVRWTKVGSTEELTSLTEVDNYQVTVAMKGESTNYRGTASTIFRIVNRIITAENVSLWLDGVKTARADYDGLVHKPEVVVTFGDETVAASNYTVTWPSDSDDPHDFTQKGAYTINVKGIGQYGGNVDRVFNINAPLLTSSKFEISRPEAVYNGTAQAPGSLTVTMKRMNGTTEETVTLTENTDYKVTWPDGATFIEAGAYVGTIQRLGNYASDVDATVTYNIEPKPLLGAMIKSVVPNMANWTTTSSETPVITIKDEDTGIPTERQTLKMQADGVERPDYKIVWKYAEKYADGSAQEQDGEVTPPFTKAGIYRAYIEGMNNYIGSPVADFELMGRSLHVGDGNTTVTFNPAYGIYSGTTLDRPTVTVKDGETTLTEGTDYTLSWTDAELKEAGAYQVTITGKNNYLGTTIVEEFNIRKKAIETVMLKMMLDETETYAAKKPEGDGKVQPRLDVILPSTNTDITDQCDITWSKYNTSTSSWEDLTGDALSANPASFTETGTYRATAKAKEGSTNFMGQASRTFIITENEPDNTVTSVLDASIEFYLGSSEVPDATYNGTVQKPDVKIMNGDTDVTSNFDIKGLENEIGFTDAGNYVITAVGKESTSYTGIVRTRTFTIKPMEIADASWVKLLDTSDNPYVSTVYTGSAVTKPTVKVYNGESALTENTDYTKVEEQTGDWTNAGKYYIRVTGQGNYQGEQRRYFEITQKDIRDNDVVLTFTPSLNYTYDGQEHKPGTQDGDVITLKHGTYDLQKGELGEGKDPKDFILFYEGGNFDWKSAGSHTLNIEGRGNYCGAIPKTIVISPKAIKGDWITFEPASYDYDGETHDAPTVIVNDPGLAEGSQQLTLGTDFTIAWEEDYTFKDAGGYKVKVIGKGNYIQDATATKTFTILPKDVNRTDITINTEANEEYKIEASTTGKVPYRKDYSYVPQISITVDGKTLEEGGDKDFYVSGWVNKATGDAIAVNSAGKYAFSEIGEYEATINTRGNYKAEVHKVSFTIEPRTLDSDKGQITMELKVADAADETYAETKKVVYNATGYTPRLTLKNEVGNLLIENTDYTLVWMKDGVAVTEFKNAGFYEAVFTGKGSYKDTKSVGFDIVPAPLDVQNWFDVYVTTDGTKTPYTEALTYDGKAHTPSLELSSEAPISAADYEVGPWVPSGYTDAATYTVTIKGKGNYSDEVKTRTMVILPKHMTSTDISVAFSSGDTHATYSAEGLTPPAITVKDGTTGLTADGEQPDYKVTWEYRSGDTSSPLADGKMNKAGSWIATISGQNNYDMGRTLTFTVDPLAIASTDITIKANDGKAQAEYTGSEITTELEVKVATATLTADDYEVVGWIRNGEAVDAVKDAGSYQVVVKGKGNYAATEAVSVNTFTVVKKKVEAIDVTMDIPTTGKSLPSTISGTTPAEVIDGTKTTVSWAGTDATAEVGKDYTVTVKLAPEANHEFSSSMDVTVNSNEATEKTVESDGSLILTYTFHRGSLNFSGTGQWATFYSDKAVKLGSGLTAYIVSSVSSTAVNVTELGSDVIPAGLPVLLNRGTSTATSFDYTEVSQGGSKPTYDAAYRGADEATAIERGSYILIDDAFVKSEAGSLPANRCYLTVSVSGARTRTIIINGGDATAIERVEAEDVEGQWFTLDGHRIEKPQRKGVYILNNKKVVIK